MSIPFYGCEAHGGRILALDDASTVEDTGTAYEAYAISTEYGTGGGFLRLRRIVQAVHHEGAVTVTVTPYRDGNEGGPAIERVLAIGANPIVQAPAAVGGTRFQVKIALSAFDAPAELGLAELWVVPRRAER